MIRCWQAPHALSQLETAATPAQAWALHGVLLECSSPAVAARRPARVGADVDATHVPLHGAQERAFFHGYYDNSATCRCTCSAGQDLLACVLRPSDRDPASVVTAVLKLWSTPGQVWPKVRIVVRADSASADRACCAAWTAGAWTTCWA